MSPISDLNPAVTRDELRQVSAQRAWGTRFGNGPYSNVRMPNHTASDDVDPCLEGFQAIGMLWSVNPPRLFDTSHAVITGPGANAPHPWVCTSCGLKRPLYVSLLAPSWPLSLPLLSLTSDGFRRGRPRGSASDATSAAAEPTVTSAAAEPTVYELRSQEQSRVPWSRRRH